MPLCSYPFPGEEEAHELMPDLLPRKRALEDTLPKVRGRQAWKGEGLHAFAAGWVHTLASSALCLQQAVSPYAHCPCDCAHKQHHSCRAFYGVH